MDISYIKHDFHLFWSKMHFENKKIKKSRFINPLWFKFSFTEIKHFNMIF